MAVDRDDREIVARLEIGAVGQGDDAVGLVLAHHVEALLLGLGVEVRDHEQAAVAPAHETGRELVRQVREKGMAQRRHDERDAVGLVRLETAGIGVHMVAEGPDRRLHAAAVALADGDAVDDLGDRPDRDAGLAGDILHGGRRVGSAHAAPSFCIAVLYYKIIPKNRVLVNGNLHADLRVVPPQ